MKNLCLFLLVIPLGLSGQPGGKAFQFLDETNSARIAALGGKAIAVYDNDLNMPYFNPSLLNSEMDKHLVLNYVNFLPVSITVMPHTLPS
ncbi:MAG: hypothetical protein HC906_03670 [Bacteroidales bacterium]|nr:hypothetical protein [Bacteroidales bacterium]